jgi:predicted Rossmann fold nucleotide-binding protein DprA/Smf involved in DNA uptake
MSDRQAVKERAQVLKDLRNKHQETVTRTQTLLKEQGKVERDILKLIKDEPKTIPVIAGELKLPSHRILWFLTALKKYDRVQEDGMDGEYVLYKRREE